MTDTLSYLWWQADRPREPFADTFAAALRAHEARFGRAATSALVPLGMAGQVGHLPPRIIVEERATVPVGTVMVR